VPEFEIGAQSGRIPRSLLSSSAYSARQNRPELITNPVGDFLGIGEDIGIAFSELNTPKLGSIVRVNEFHVQEQFFIWPNDFSYGNNLHKQILPQRTRIEVSFTVLLNCVVGQNPQFPRLGDGVDDLLDDPPTQKNHLSGGGFGGKWQYCQRT
jgi:hypothetical protein